MTGHHVVFWSLCGLISLLPLPFGSTAEWAVTVFQVAVFALAGVHIFARKEADPLRAPLVMRLALGAFLAFTVLQLIPLPPPVIETLSPRAHTAHVQAATVAGSGEGWRTLSLSPAATGYELLTYIGYFLFGFLVFNHVRTRKETKTFVLFLIATAVLEALYGILELFGGTERIFGYKRDYHLGSATGTFINRDHFSGFLEMALPLTLGYLLDRADFFAFRKGWRVREKLLWFSQERLQKTVVIGLAAAIIGLGIVFSHSRTGIFIFGATIFMMIAAISAWSGRPRGEAAPGRRRFVRVLRTVALLVVFAATLIGIRPVIERFSWANMRKEERPVFYGNTLALIRAFPLAGVGPGAFVDAYPAFDRRSNPGLVDHAHDDYLEILAESGLVFGGTIILLALATWTFLFARWAGLTDNIDRGIVLGAVLGILAILIHSLTDFNLRIPSNAAIFAALYGLALHKMLERRREGREKNEG